MEIDIKKVMSLDLYNILDIDEDASESNIRKAYKKKALKCHPDKNPDNPDAAAEFVQLTEALEVLLDASARKAYNNFLKAKKATAIRNRQLESKRKHLKEELEARENAALQKTAKEKFVKDQQTKDAAKQLEQEIQRLRKEGSRLVAEEQEKLQQQLREEASQLYNDPDSSIRLRVKWRSAKSDVNNGGYNADSLQHIFKKYGEVTALLVSKKKNGSAIVEFSTHDAAVRAIHETGDTHNPLAVSWLTAASAQSTSHSANSSSTQVLASAVSSAHSEASSGDATGVDFESLVLMRLRQAEERKRLNQQLAAEHD